MNFFLFQKKEIYILYNFPNLLKHYKADFLLFLNFFLLNLDKMKQLFSFIFFIELVLIDRVFVKLNYIL